MKLKELIAFCREESRDRNPPYKVSDEQWTRFANEGENEACRRGRLLVDSTSQDIAVYDITAGARLLELSPLVIFIRRVQLDSQELPLRKIRRADLDQMDPGWEARAETGLVEARIHDYESRKLAWYRLPEDDDVARMTVVRLPLQPMALGNDPNTTDEPEIRPDLHVKLTHWMLYRYHRRTHPDTYDPERAKAEYDLFTLEFGPPSPAYDEQWIDQRYGEDDNEGLY